VGPVKLSGYNIQQAKKQLNNKLGQYFNGSTIDLSLTEARTIQVQVMGEVELPGTYTLSSLSSAFNALYLAGGISKIGTLRNIQVYRKGKLINTIDVYDYILNGNIQGDVRLEDNDLIIVGPYDCLIQIKGNVKRPMWYEMKKNETAQDLLKYSGGFNGNAYTKKIRITRKFGDEYSVHTIDENKWSIIINQSKSSTFVYRNGSVIVVTHNSVITYHYALVFQYRSKVL
jgi:protein involved in polysaccharide export with SLBB domain